MGFPEYRPRRLRRNEKLRGMVQEHELSSKHLVYPLFIKEGDWQKDGDSIDARRRSTFDRQRPVRR